LFPVVCKRYGRVKGEVAEFSEKKARKDSVP